MKQCWFLLLLAINGCLSNSSSEKPHPSAAFHLPLVLEANGLPHCAHYCLSDLYLTAVELFTLKNPVRSFKDLCINYHNASLCIFSQEDCVNEFTFSSVFSGIHELCSIMDEKLESHADCLENTTANILQTCDRTCYFVESITGLSENEKQSLLKPFYLAEILLNKLGPRARSAIKKRLPHECHYLIDLRQLERITYGKPPEELPVYSKEKDGKEMYENDVSSEWYWTMRGNNTLD
ncbi:unnamed protein product [Angiostrongylus costaricensis]|uniref:CPG4 domain-containing protein n=1 Tax=Angiostrongylus costaricensis TaxID=334426 RepID=A0A0R3Q082_ANGCS|nr:unnamed protein product [Angiostrongylus costaricensis]